MNTLHAGNLRETSWHGQDRPLFVIPPEFRDKAAWKQEASSLIGLLQRLAVVIFVFLLSNISYLAAKWLFWKLAMQQEILQVFLLSIGSLSVICAAAYAALLSLQGLGKNQLSWPAKTALIMSLVMGFLVLNPNLLSIAAPHLPTGIVHAFFHATSLPYAGQMASYRLATYFFGYVYGPRFSSVLPNLMELTIAFVLLFAGRKAPRDILKALLYSLSALFLVSQWGQFAGDLIKILAGSLPSGTLTPLTFYHHGDYLYAFLLFHHQPPMTALILTGFTVLSLSVNLAVAISLFVKGMMTAMTSVKNPKFKNAYVVLLLAFITASPSWGFGILVSLMIMAALVSTGLIRVRFNRVVKLGILSLLMVSLPLGLAASGLLLLKGAFYELARSMQSSAARVKKPFVKMVMVFLLITNLSLLPIVYKKTAPVHQIKLEQMTKSEHQIRAAALLRQLPQADFEMMLNQIEAHQSALQKIMREKGEHLSEFHLLLGFIQRQRYLFGRQAELMEALIHLRELDLNVARALVVTETERRTEAAFYRQPRAEQEKIVMAMVERFDQWQKTIEKALPWSEMAALPILTEPGFSEIVNARVWLRFFFFDMASEYQKQAVLNKPAFRNGVQAVRQALSQKAWIDLAAGQIRRNRRGMEKAMPMEIKISVPATAARKSGSKATTRKRKKIVKQRIVPAAESALLAAA